MSFVLLRTQLKLLKDTENLPNLQE